MDVRCEKCGTEYELDDSRMKPAGVSVKCTSCGHVFRVRRHPVTSVGVGGTEMPPAQRRPDTERDLEPVLDDEPEAEYRSDTIPIPTMTAGPTPGPRQVRMTPSNARSLARNKERNWLVRLPGGEIETCRELATLHQWIIAGKVTRNSGISRTGKSWKKLGEIRELGPFFDVAEETRRNRMSGIGAAGTPGREAAEARPKAGSDSRPELRPGSWPEDSDDGSDEGEGLTDVEAHAEVEAVLRARQMPRVIQPIPDSFSASGPIEKTEVEAGPGSDVGAGNDTWGEPQTMESMAPGALHPDPPVLPARAGSPALAAGAAPGGAAKRTLLGAAGGRAPSVPAFGSSFTDDDDEGPTEEVDVALAFASMPPGQAGGRPPSRGGPADDGEPGRGDDDDDGEPGPEVDFAAGLAAGPGGARGNGPHGDDDLDDDDEPGFEEPKAGNPLNQKLPRFAEATPAGPVTRPAAGDATKRPAGHGVLASTLRGPAPVPMAPPGRSPSRSEDDAPAAAAVEAGAGPRAGTGPAARLHAAAQDKEAIIERALDDEPDEKAPEEDQGPRRVDRAGLARAASMDGPQGPTAGVARRSAVKDVAFAGGKIRPLPEEAGDEDRTDMRPPPGSSRAGRWIVVAALVLMAASAAVVYVLVFRPTGDPIEGIGLEGDAGSELAAGGDGGAEPAESAELAELVRTRLAMDTHAGLEALDRQLQGMGSEAMLAARARVHTAMAQHLFDEATLMGSDAVRRGELEREAKALVLEALTLAQRALQQDREDPSALVAMADVQRLQGRPGQQVESYLAQALAREPEHREARLVRALLLAASERTRRDARALLDTLAQSAQGIDVRPAYRLALLDVAEARNEDARRRVTEVLAVAPEHEDARALLAYLDANPTVDTSDPMPVEEGREPESGKEQGGKEPGGKEPGKAQDGKDQDGKDTGSGSYRDLVAQADKKAKAGDCDEAMKLYERALDDDPSGVSALMGMAECHVTRKEFASAYGKLQAVLAVSPSNAEAMWRMAETYRKQGLSSQAVSWYRKYVEENPSGSRAHKARQRIEELGGGASEPSPAPGGGSTEPPAGGGNTEPPAGGGSTEPPAGQGDPPPAPAPGGTGDSPGGA